MKTTLGPIKSEMQHGAIRRNDSLVFKYLPVFFNNLYHNLFLKFVVMFHEKVVIDTDIKQIRPLAFVHRETVHIINRSFFH